MKTFSAALKVGITTLLILVMSAGAYRFVSKSMRRPRRSGGGALFKDATGLVDKSRVQVAGLLIGGSSTADCRATWRGSPSASAPRPSCGPTQRSAKKSSSLLASTTSRSIPARPRSPDPLSGQMTRNHRLQSGDRIVNVVEAITTSGHPVSGQRDAADRARHLARRAEADAGPGAGHCPRRAGQHRQELGSHHAADQARR